MSDEPLASSAPPAFPPLHHLHSFLLPCATSTVIEVPFSTPCVCVCVCGCGCSCGGIFSLLPVLLAAFSLRLVPASRSCIHARPCRGKLTAGIDRSACACTRRHVLRAHSLHPTRHHSYSFLFLVFCLCFASLFFLIVVTFQDCTSPRSSPPSPFPRTSTQRSTYPRTPTPKTPVHMFLPRLPCISGLVSPLPPALLLSLTFYALSCFFFFSSPTRLTPM